MKITKSQLKQIIKEEIAVGDEHEILEDLKRAVMIAYDIDRKITPENTELMREIDSIIEKYNIAF